MNKTSAGHRGGRLRPSVVQKEDRRAVEAQVGRRTATLSRTRLSYVEMGDSGPAVVLLHGLTDSLDAYLPVAAGLCSQARVFALDLRGHGGSSSRGGHGR